VLLLRQEAEHGAVAVKDMQSGDQQEVPRQLVAGWLRERLETETEDTTQ